MARDVCGRASDVWSAGVVMYQVGVMVVVVVVVMIG